MNIYYFSYNKKIKSADTEADMLNRVREELRRAEQAKKRRIRTARISFAHWLQSKISSVGRAIGYRIFISKYECAKVYDWLFNDLIK